MTRRTHGPGWADQDDVRFMLEDCDTWAVVGLSGDPSRTAYEIARYLQQRGKRIVPIHPSSPTVLGEQGYASLADVPFPVDVVDVFRRSEAAGEFADQAVAIGARAVWFQLGVVDATAFDHAVSDVAAARRFPPQRRRRQRGERSANPAGAVGAGRLWPLAGQRERQIEEEQDAGESHDKDAGNRPAFTDS